MDTLGLGDQLVGISHECDFPEGLLKLPRVSRPRFDPTSLASGEIDRAVREAMATYGSVYEIDTTILATLNPSIVLTQAVCEVCAVPTSGVQEALGSLGLEAEIISLDAHSIEDILDSLIQVGEAVGHVAVAQTKALALRDRLSTVQEAVSQAPRIRVLAIEWLDPPFAPGHWVPEMVEIAGAENLIGTPGQPSHQVVWSDLQGLDPDALIIMPCGYGLEAAYADADKSRDRLVEIAPRAISERRAFVVDASAYFNRSGPRFVTGVEILAGLLHPTCWPAAAAEHATVWSAN